MKSSIVLATLFAMGCAGAGAVRSREGSDAQEARREERRREAVALVERFWARTWNPPHDVGAVDELMVEDFVITSGGEDVVGRAAFKEWVRAFQARAADLHLTAHETFANVDGTRVVSRWTASAVNRGAFGLEPDGRPFELTGIALWEVRWTDAGPKLAHNWVERAAFEAYQRLRRDAP